MLNSEKFLMSLLVPPLPYTPFPVFLKPPIPCTLIFLRPGEKWFQKRFLTGPDAILSDGFSFQISLVSVYEPRGCALVFQGASFWYLVCLIFGFRIQG